MNNKIRLYTINKIIIHEIYLFALISTIPSLIITEISCNLFSVDQSDLNFNVLKVKCNFIQMYATWIYFHHKCKLNKYEKMKLFFVFSEVVFHLKSSIFCEIKGQIWSIINIKFK